MKLAFVSAAVLLATIVAGSVAAYRTPSPTPVPGTPFPTYEQCFTTANGQTHTFRWGNANPNRQDGVTRPGTYIYGATGQAWVDPSTGEILPQP